MGGPAVAYNLTIDVQPTYVSARVVGERTPQNMMRFFNEVNAICTEHGVWSVLIEINFSGPSMGIGNVYEVVSKGSRDGMKLERVAYVEAALGPTESARFAETVAINRGVNIRLFKDVESAKAWLAGH